MTDRVPEIGFSGIRNQPKKAVFKRSVDGGFSSFSQNILNDFPKFCSMHLFWTHYTLNIHQKTKKIYQKKRLRIALFNFYPISKSLPGTSKAPKTRVSSTIPNSSLVKKRRNKVSSRPVCVCMYQAPVFCYFFLSVYYIGLATL